MTSLSPASLSAERSNRKAARSMLAGRSFLFAWTRRGGWWRGRERERGRRRRRRRRLSSPPSLAAAAAAEDLDVPEEPRPLVLEHDAVLGVLVVQGDHQVVQKKAFVFLIFGFFFGLARSLARARARGSRCLFFFSLLLSFSCLIPVSTVPASPSARPRRAA